MRWVLLIGIPSAVALFVLAAPMITTLFMYRDFNAADVDMAGLSLMAYAIGLPGFMLIKVLAPAFYARKDPRTPVRIAVVALLTNIVLNLAFVVPMVKMNIPGPHAGLALATLGSRLGKCRVVVHGAGAPVYLPATGRVATFFSADWVGRWSAGRPAVVGRAGCIQHWVGWNAGERALQLLQWVAIGAVRIFPGTACLRPAAGDTVA